MLLPEPTRFWLLLPELLELLLLAPVPALLLALA
jgi:hypothetical protein